MIRDFIVAFQPANATTNQPVAVYFPNTLNTPPGTDMPLMTLDPTHGTMVPYGTGAVSADGTQIVPDPDPAHPGHLYGLVHFDWHGPMPPPPPQIGIGGDGPCLCPVCSCGVGSGPVPVGGPGASGPGFGGGGSGGGGSGSGSGGGSSGTLIDFSSGVFVIQHTDITLNGTRGSIEFTRVLRTASSGVAGPFGIGGSHRYDLRLDSLTAGTAASFNLVMPDGRRIPFVRQPNGTLVNTVNPAFLGAVFTTTSDDSATLRFKSGVVWAFQEHHGNVFGTALASISDPNGNSITLTRNSSVPQQITVITDPVGRQLTITYDNVGTGRITSISDPIGRTLSYTYTSAGHLATFTDANGGVWQYSYDSGGNLTTVTDPAQRSDRAE